MHGADGIKALLPAREVVGFVLDALEQGVFAEVGEHDAVRAAREQMRHVDTVRFQGLQPPGFGRDDGAATGIGHGFERIEVENGGEVADQGIAPLRDTFPCFTYPDGFTAGKGMAGDVGGLPGKDGGKRRLVGVIVHDHDGGWFVVVMSGTVARAVMRCKFLS